MQQCDTCGEVKTCRKICPDMEKLLRKEEVSDRRDIVYKVDPMSMDKTNYRDRETGKRKRPHIFDDNWEPKNQ